MKPPKNSTVPFVILTVLATTALVEWRMGRAPLGPDGKFGLWESNIWSNECSQRFADPYSFSHIAHGLIFFAFLWLLARSLAQRHRYFIALLMEAGWELLENSPFIINRYREGTIAVGYVGDSILNSMSDILMMSLGFFLASRLPVWGSILLFLAMEIGCALWIHDNLTLNVIMLIHPISAIKAWQTP
jgi:hypothetical protein